MGETLLVETTPHWARVAILEDGELAELYLERTREATLLGTIFKGRVSRILPGMQAAFVDAGLERDVFLYVDEVRRGESGLAWEEDEEEGVEPPPGEPIEALLSVGDEILVQILKEPLATKGARVTTVLTLPGRYLVYVPGASHRGISRRITDETERERLRQILEQLPAPDAGLIVRTVGEGADAESLGRDLAFLTAQHARILERAAKLGAPSLVHRDLSLPMRILRDRVGASIDAVWIDGRQTHADAAEYLAVVEPALLDRLHEARPPRSLFARYQIDEAIEDALAERVQLRSGGSIVIQQTEALVAVDVNTGRYVGRRNLEETARHTNLEAAREVARQIRLRNLSGIIVVDFIDMESEEHRAEVLAALESAFASDRARTRVLAMSEFGLVEITRKRGRPSLERMLTTACSCCGGRGRVQAPGSVAQALRRAVLDHLDTEGSRRVEVRVHADLAAALSGGERAVREELAEAIGAPLEVVVDSALPPGGFEVRRLA